MGSHGQRRADAKSKSDINGREVVDNIIAKIPTFQPSLRLPHIKVQDRISNTMAGRGLKPVFGGGPVGKGKDFPDIPTIEELYKLLKEGGCDTIDTSRLYSNSEEWIGKTHGGDQFIIDSKTPGGFIAGGSNAAGIVQHAKETVERLGVKNVSDWRIGREPDLIGSAGRHILHPLSGPFARSRGHAQRHQRCLQGWLLQALWFE